MKNIFTLFALLLTMYSGNSQPIETSRRLNNYQSKFTVSTLLSDRINIQIDGSNYNTRGNEDAITINNIRSGYHSVKVFRQKKSRNNYIWNNSKKMQLIYEGNIYVKPQFHVDLVINRFGKVFVDERRIDPRYDHEDDDQNEWGNMDDDLLQPMNTNAFEQFKQVIRNENFDNTRLVLARQTISENYFSSAQVKEILHLFSFENNKLDMAEYSYKYTVDKKNYFILNDAFAFSSSKEELARFIKAYR